MWMVQSNIRKHFKPSQVHVGRHLQGGRFVTATLNRLWQRHAGYLFPIRIEIVGAFRVDYPT